MYGCWMFVAATLKEWQEDCIPKVLEKGTMTEEKWGTLSREEKIRRVVKRWLKTGRQGQRRAKKRLAFRKTGKICPKKQKSIGDVAESPSQAAGVYVYLNNAELVLKDHQ